MSHSTKQYIIAGLASSATITPQAGKRLVVTEEDDTTTKPKKPRPSYDTIGNGMTTRHFTSYPYEETLLELSKPEAWFFKILLRAWRNGNGYSDISHTPFTPTEKVVASNAYKKLRERQLVRKVRNQVYMINPTAKINLTLFDELYAAWKALDKPKKSKTVVYEKIYVHPKHFWIKGYKAWSFKHNVYLLKEWG